jgi:trehalose/maltose transport system substrate-binding protein
MQHRCWAIAGILVFAGCRSARQPAAPVKLTVFGFTLEAGELLRRDALNDFTQRTGIEVEVIPTLGGSAEQTALALKLLGRKSKTPDVFVVDLVWTGTLGEHLLDLSPKLTDEARSHFPALLESGTVGQRVVGLPFYMNAGALFYRADLLKKYGYQNPPGTWGELADMARSIQQKERRLGRSNFWGYVWQGASYEGLTCNALEWQLSFGGGHIIENTGTISANNPRAAAALKNAAGWVASISPPSVLAYMESDSYNAFRSGQAAFLRHWSSSLRRFLRSMPAGSVGIAQVPAGAKERAHTLGGFHLAVSRHSLHPREATDLVLYLTSAEVQKRRAMARGILPTYSHVYRDPDVERAFPEIRKLLQVGTQAPALRPSVVAGANYARVSKAYHETVHRILSRKVSAPAGLQSLEQDLTAIMNSPQEKPAGLEHDR